MRTLLLLSLALTCELGCVPDVPESNEARRVNGTDGGSKPDGGGPGPDFGPGFDMMCPRVEVKLTPFVPRVQLLLDQSGSMTEADFPFNGQNISRWDALKKALIDPTSGVVTRLQSAVKLGATLYTGVKATPTTAAMCPKLTATQAAQIDNGAAIQTLLMGNQPLDDTPTAESITATVNALKAIPNIAVEKPIIVLATDGDPDTCAAPDSNGTQPPRDASVQAAQAAYAAGFPIVVLSVGTQVTQAHLQDMANAGAGLAIGGATKATYYQASSTQGLVDSFNAIIRGTRSCQVALAADINPSGAASGEVRLNGAPLVYNDPSGWKLVDARTIELVGDACTTLKQTDNVTITASFDCQTVVR